MTLRCCFLREKLEMVYVTLSVVCKHPKKDLHCILNEAIKSMEDKRLILTLIKNKKSLLVKLFNNWVDS